MNEQAQEWINRAENELELEPDSPSVSDRANYTTVKVLIALVYQVAELTDCIRTESPVRAQDDGSKRKRGK
jgi:hypothetical protein